MGAGARLIGGEFVGDVVTHLVLGGVVPFLFLDELKRSAFARVGRVEDAGIELDALAQALDHAEARVIHRALDHLNHVIDLGSVRARNESGAGADQLFHRIDGLIDRAGRIGLALEPNRGSRRSLFLGQAIDEIVHDEIDHVDVLARAVIEMVAADRETVTVAAEQKDIQIRPGQTDAAGERDGAAMNEVGAVPLTK